MDRTTKTDTAKGQTVCLITHPVSYASEPAIEGLLEVVAASANSVSLVTANLPEESKIWTEYEVNEISDFGVGDSILVAAYRFVLNQIRMSKVIRDRDEDVVLFFGATAYILPIIMSRLFGKKVILEPRGNVPDSLRRIWAERLPEILAYLLSRPVWLLERLGFHLANAIFVLSPSMADDLGLRKPRFEEKLYEHGARPVDVDRFKPITPYAERELVVGYLGRLDEEKGVDVLTEAVKHLSKDIKFLFIGDGALRNHIETELSDRIADGSVEITGWVEHDSVPEYLNSIRFLVMTSRTEGVPTTALEAMACGTPVLATAVGGIPDVIKEGESGFLIEKDQTPDEIANRIEKSLKKENLNEMSQSARSYILENFRFEAVVEKYRRVFEEVTSHESK